MAKALLRRSKAKASKTELRIAELKSQLETLSEQMKPLVAEATMLALEGAGDQGLTWAEWRAIFKGVPIPGMYLDWAMNKLGPLHDNKWKTQYNHGKSNMVYIIVGKDVPADTKKKKRAASYMRRSLIKKKG